MYSFKHDIWENATLSRKVTLIRNPLGDIIMWIKWQTVAVMLSWLGVSVCVGSVYTWACCGKPSTIRQVILRFPQKRAENPGCFTLNVLHSVKKKKKKHCSSFSVFFFFFAVTLRAEMKSLSLYEEMMCHLLCIYYLYGREMNGSVIGYGIFIIQN